MTMQTSQIFLAIYLKIKQEERGQEEMKKILNYLLTKIVDAKKPQIIPEVKYIPVKIEDPKPKYDDVVTKKEPKIYPGDENALNTRFKCL